MFVDSCEKIRKHHHRRSHPPGADRPPRAAIAARSAGSTGSAASTRSWSISAPANPTLLLISGSYTPPVPRTPEEEASGESIPHAPLPKGFVMFAGGGITAFRDALALACGNAQTCSGDASPYAYTFGATYWFTRNFGVEGSFLHPAKLKASGGDGHAFDSTLNADIWNILGKAGVQGGPVRIYGQGGMTYHQATHTTNQTIGEAYAEVRACRPKAGATSTAAARRSG